jgi:hypothetical protein
VFSFAFTNFRAAVTESMIHKPVIAFCGLRCVRLGVAWQACFYARDEKAFDQLDQARCQCVTSASTNISANVLRLVVESAPRNCGVITIRTNKQSFSTSRRGGDVSV